LGSFITPRFAAAGNKRTGRDSNSVRNIDWLHLHSNLLFGVLVMLKEFLKRLFCRHKNIYFIRNIYGDEINQVSDSKTYRSWWKCADCDKFVKKEKLAEKYW
jgi:hypothetical protein